MCVCVCVCVCVCCVCVLCVCVCARQRHKALATYCLLRSYARHSPMHWSIDALISGHRFLPRHINHIPTHPHNTLTRAKPQIQLHNGKIKQIYIMEIPQISQNRMEFLLVTRSVVLLTQCAPYCCLITDTDNLRYLLSTELNTY